MEIEIARAHGLINQRGWIHCLVGGSEGSNLITPIVCWFFGYKSNQSSNADIYCDSKSTIHLIRNHVYHAKRKHIEVQFHHIQELVVGKKLEVQMINIEVNIVDCLTKPLPDHRFRTLRTMMGLRQAIDQKRAKQIVAKGKSITGSSNPMRSIGRSMYVEHTTRMHNDPNLAI